ncbi:FGGY-family carbohydrate kinase [Ohessyouella blattaphilus]|uniref:ATP:glycerol 3-phosphotransferase n=1 Tax=Ohessyouella blattaphilus TaxID=2949333 RepID=A0ABT1EM65_9FIRM|nr:glycerol kinase [Ohessyouella blattaphilus]MCP1110791.1 glycerol kinase GlpK [Ohessyouella blattaphilus]MCR8564185.1 glycerol kinase GlpK [Ohessyouella blattaphilus]
MSNQYILSIDQSTQGTKALLFDNKGTLITRADRPHKQILHEKGWVSHNLDEIYKNVIGTVKDVVDKAGIDKNCIIGLGISNQRETAAVWDRRTGVAVTDAIVWQCSRAKAICERLASEGSAAQIKDKTGIQLSPFFPASKIAWILENVEEAQKNKENLLYGTIDTWLVYRLTNGNAYKTDYSNASRTQLFNLKTLAWDEEICNLFGIDVKNLAQVCDSNSLFGYTDLEGFLDKAIPIQAVMGDSHSALYGQGCHENGMAKTTYGTGSSVMMNVGEKLVASKNGIVSSLAWGIDGKVNYVLEGNINYTGAVISWLESELQLIASAKETEALAKKANEKDGTYFVPAFTGLGAPYWVNDTKALITGIGRTTGKAEIVKAALECIAYQIADIIQVMKKDSGIELRELRVDGGPTRNEFLMQFQSDIADLSVQVPGAEELSGIGVAYMAGIALGLYDRTVFSRIERKTYETQMRRETRDEKYRGWHKAIELVIK